MSFRAFVFILLLSSAKGLPPEQADIAMRDRKIAMSEHNTAVEIAPEKSMELTDEELAQQDRVFALWSGRRSPVWFCKETLFRMASAGDASARAYLQRLVRDYPGDNAMDARYAGLPDKASTAKDDRKKRECLEMCLYKQGGG